MKTIEELIKLGLIKKANHQTGNFNEVIQCYYLLRKSYGNFMPGQYIFKPVPYYEKDILSEEWQAKMFADEWEGWA